MMWNYSVYMFFVMYLAGQYTSHARYSEGGCIYFQLAFET